VRPPLTVGDQSLFNDKAIQDEQQMTTVTGAIEAFLLSLIGAPPSEVTIGRAQDHVRDYLSDEKTGTSWKGLDKKAWCDRVIELLGEPKKINQGQSKYCKPAACLFVLFSRVPVIMADFCVALASTGKGSINKLKIKMTKDIQDYGVPAYAAGETIKTDPVDFILLLAIQNAMSTFNIDSPDDHSASPSMSASDIEDVLDDTKLFTIKKISSPKASALTDQKADTDLILVGNSTFYLDHQVFSKHAAVVVPPLTADASSVKFCFWSWGMAKSEYTDVEGGYYVKRATNNAFESNVEVAFFLTLKQP